MGKSLIHGFITYVELQFSLPLSQAESDMHYFQEASKLANSSTKSSVVSVVQMGLLLKVCLQDM